MFAGVQDHEHSSFRGYPRERRSNPRVGMMAARVESELLALASEGDGVMREDDEGKRQNVGLTNRLKDTL